MYIIYLRCLIPKDPWIKTDLLIFLHNFNLRRLANIYFYKKNYRDSFFLLCIQMFLMVTFFKLILHPAQSDNMTKEKFAENFLANDISARKISFRDLKG